MAQLIRFRSLVSGVKSAKSYYETSLVDISNVIKTAAKPDKSEPLFLEFLFRLNQPLFRPGRR
jgi:hypothetical protein